MLADTAEPLTHQSRKMCYLKETKNTEMAMPYFMKKMGWYKYNFIRPSGRLLWGAIIQLY